MEFSVPRNSHTDGNGTSQTFRLWKDLQKRFDAHEKTHPQSPWSRKSQPVVSLFVYLCGQSVLDIFDFVTVKDKEQFISDTLRKLEDTCIPALLLLYHRFRFFTRHQESEESVCDFTAGLEELVVDCQFGSREDEYMVKQISRGTSDDALRFKLLYAKDLNARKAIQMCQESNRFSFLTQYRNQGTAKNVSEHVPLLTQHGNHDTTKKASERFPLLAEYGNPDTTKKVSEHFPLLTGYGNDGTTKKVSEHFPLLAEYGNPDTTKKVSERFPLLAKYGNHGTTKKVSKRFPALTKYQNDCATKKVLERFSLWKKYKNQSTSNKMSESYNPRHATSKTESSALERRRSEDLNSTTKGIENCVDGLGGGGLEEGTEEAPECDADNESSDIQENSSPAEENSHADDLTSIPSIEELDPVTDDASSLVSDLICRLSDVRGVKNPYVRLSPLSFVNISSANLVKQEPLTCSNAIESSGQIEIDRLTHQDENECSVDVPTETNSEVIVASASAEDIKGDILEDFVMTLSEESLDFNVSSGQILLNDQPHVAHEASSPACQVDEVWIEHVISDEQLQTPSGISEHKTGSQTCHDCGCSFNSEANLKEHECRNKSLRCRECGCSFERETEHRGHRCQKVAAGIQCPHCPATFQHPALLRAHKVQHMKKTHICDHCGKAYLTKAALSAHWKKKHIEGGLMCNICGSTCGDKRSLEIHERKHSGERPFICEFCGITFILKGDLTRHIKYHTDEKPFQCSVCEFRCITASILKLHMMTHTGERPCKCAICGSGYRHAFDLKQHMKRTHSEERPFICKTCGAGFKCKKYLLIHEKTHTGIKAFMCDICEKTFSRLTNMRAHRKTHFVGAAN